MTIEYKYRHNDGTVSIFGIFKEALENHQRALELQADKELQDKLDAVCGRKPLDEDDYNEHSDE